MRAFPFPMPVESAGIPDLDLDQVLLSPSNVKRGSRATITADGVAAERLRKLRSGVAGGDMLNECANEVTSNSPPATVSSSVSMSSRIMMISYKEVCNVNNIWLKASQCLTARVDA